MKDKPPFALQLPILLIALLFTASGEAYARDDGFSARSVKGTWGFTLNGTFLPSETFAFPTPAAAAGITIYDGEGGCSLSATLNVGGQVTPQPVESTDCSYTVDPSGAGTQETTVLLPLGSDPVPVTFLTNFVIVDRVNELPFILSEKPGMGLAPIVATGAAKRITRNSRRGP